VVVLAAGLYLAWKVVCHRADVLPILEGISCPQVLKQPPLPHILLFLVVFAGLAAFSSDIKASLFHCYQMATLLGTFLMMVCLRQLPPQHRRTRLVVHALLLGDVADAVYGLYQVHTMGHLRVTGFSTNYVFYGCLLVQAILLAAALLLETSSPLRRAAYAGVVCLCIIALVCSQARGAWISLALSFPVVVYLSRRQFTRDTRDRKWVWIYLGALTVLVLGLSPLYFGHLMTLFNPKWQANWERILIWGSTLRMIHDHPWTGVGAGQFAAIYNSHYISPVSVERYHPHAHNSFLQILSEDGIIGFAASIYLLYGIVLFLRNALRETPSSPYVIGSVAMFCALFVASLVDYLLFSGYVRPEWVLWLMLGLVYYDRPTASSGLAVSSGSAV